jgi:hypothetical protein
MGRGLMREVKRELKFFLSPGLRLARLRVLLGRLWGELKGYCTKSAQVSSLPIGRRFKMLLQSFCEQRT